MDSSVVDLGKVDERPGVHLFLDVDGEALYAGQTTQMRSRLEQHLVRQDSSATADGLLDPFEIVTVVGWYLDDDKDRRKFLAAIRNQYDPRWNRGVISEAGPLPTVSLDSADFQIAFQSQAQRDALLVPLVRIEAKLLHLLRATRKARISGSSNSVREALSVHAAELQDQFRHLAEA